MIWSWFPDWWDGMGLQACIKKNHAIIKLFVLYTYAFIYSVENMSICTIFLYTQDQYQVKHFQWCDVPILSLFTNVSIIRNWNGYFILLLYFILFKHFNSVHARLFLPMCHFIFWTLFPSVPHNKFHLVFFFK
jgi:hypothetical protein